MYIVNMKSRIRKKMCGLNLKNKSKTLEEKMFEFEKCVTLYLKMKLLFDNNAVWQLVS